MHRTRLIAVLLLASASAAHAGGAGAGTTAANFLSVGQGASSLSMGGAAIASPGGLDAAGWNPAALGRLGSTQITLSHASLATGTSQEWASAGGRMGQGSTRWAISALYQSDGDFEGRDALNLPTGTFQISDMALGLHVARPLGDRVNAGVGLKWVRESLGPTSGSGIAFDAGIQSHAGPFGFGLAARNVGGSMSFDGTSYDMPSVFGAGVSWAHPANGLRLALDANAPSAYYNDVRAGAEWRWRDRVALRSGYRANLGAPEGEPLGGASFGMGLGANGFWFDYAFLAGDADAQGRHRFGMTFRPSALASLGGRGVLGANESAPAPAKSEPVKSEPVKALAASPAPAAAMAPPITLDAAAMTRGVSQASTTPIAHRAGPPQPVMLEVSRGVKVPKVIHSKLDPIASVTNTPVARPVVAPPVAQAPAAPKAAEPLASAPAPRVEAAPRAALASEPQVDAQTVSTRVPAVTVVPRAKSTPPGPRPRSVEAQGEETLADLAKRWDTSVPRLMMENNLVTERIKPGQRIKLPPAGSR